MSDVAICVDGLGKQYRLGQRQQYRALRDTLTDGLQAPARVVRRALRSHVNGQVPPSQTMIWALKDVSFEVKRGEVLGVIGRNGAGKSTLLKLLSRITEPSEGTVDIFGRVGSLLEVGTGFNPELTGRENIFLNGAILGMRRAEIARRFDQIVDFAEIEPFLDTPVKRYSSGMYMRLAFSVAAHVETDILVVDEVLAVGDTAFQRKCLGKMEHIAGAGRTVLFVSHNMAAVGALCTTGLVLEGGRVACYGAVSGAVDRYLQADFASALHSRSDLSVVPRKAGNGNVEITQVASLAWSGVEAASFAVWEPIVFELSARSGRSNESASFWILVRSAAGPIVMSSFMYDVCEPLSLGAKAVRVRVELNPNTLTPGHYRLSVGAFDGRRDMAEWVEDCLAIEIRPEFSTGRAYDGRLGLTTGKYFWQTLAS